MNKKRWDEEELEDQLRELPQIKDSQSKEALFQAIEKKMNEAHTEKIKEPRINKKRTWIYPVIASFAAVLLLILIVPSFIHNDMPLNDLAGDYDDAADSGGPDTLFGGDESVEEEMFIMEEPEANNISERTESSADEMPETEQSIVPIPYVLDVAIPTGNGNVYQPIGFVIGEMVATDELGAGDLLAKIEYALHSPHANWGIESVSEQIQSISMIEEENTVALDFYEDNRMASLSSMESESFRNVVTEYFSVLGFDYVQFTVNGNQGFDFGQEGREVEWSLLSDNRGYYVYADEGGERYLLRGANAEEPIYEDGELISLRATLENMKNVADNAWYEPGIPETVFFDDVERIDNYAIITLTDDSALTLEQFDLFEEVLAHTMHDFSIDYFTIEGGPIEDIKEHRTTERLSTRTTPNIKYD
ncbi:hypothetical protein [Evansella cellulosilytica]|uniref:GerMN domain-containing protein n=1 Tax=Evansella cellulosilytica (strain ATCC 21833 / DSM 2522 / FERM P-1141 / JCM 9156 / N-4) TaxID=649639 RepID=E6TV30_EVAC2|nr:hypothetical protein [Evansella cellulosilytica]ADU28613.1 hypothetical protein Bcell_0327 [Evansella cellulosilytica DSM 2522]